MKICPRLDSSLDESRRGAVREAWARPGSREGLEGGVMVYREAVAKLGPEEAQYFGRNPGALARAAVAAWDAGDFKRLEILSALKPSRPELIKALGGL